VLLHPSYFVTNKERIVKIDWVFISLVMIITGNVYVLHYLGLYLFQCKIVLLYLFFYVISKLTKIKRIVYSDF
jgi:Ca2+/Na+ antiporter